MDDILKNVFIEKLVFQGYGLGHDGTRTVFVNYALPGDSVDVRVTKRKAGVFFGEIIAYQKKSSLHIVAPCASFGECGGCSWLNLDYPSQLRFKTEIARQYFEKISVEEVKPSPKINFYRNKAYYPFGEKDGELCAGFYARGSHRIIPHQSCLLQPPVFQEILTQVLVWANKAKVKPYNEVTRQGCLRHLGIRQNQYGEILLIVVTNTRKLPFSNLLIREITSKFPQIVGVIQNINPDYGNRILGFDDKILYGAAVFTDKIGETEYSVHYQSFFQINRDTAYNILETIKSYAGQSIVDAYSGPGTIGCYLAKTAKKVIFIENNEHACHDAQENCRLNDLKNVEIINGNTETVLPKLQMDRNSTLIFDPPRAGLMPAAISAALGFRRIIYLSCNISTQKRDLEAFLSRGYRVIACQPFDMFPHSWHLENLIIMDKI